MEDEVDGLETGRIYNDYVKERIYQELMESLTVIMSEYITERQEENQIKPEKKLPGHRFE
jgi:hypothetical protein